MNKPQSLADFHFDPAKSGKILKSWIQNAGVSYAYVSKETGITQDTLNNCLRGLVQDLRIERVFKIGLVTGHTVQEYITEMLKEEEIDFADQVNELNAQPIVAAVVEVPQPADVPIKPEAKPLPVDFEAYAQRLHLEQNEILDRFKLVYGAYIEQLKEGREIMKAQYERQIEALERKHQEYAEELKKAHADTLARADEEIKRLRKSNRWKSIALTAETVLVVGVCMYDLANHNVGWYRGLLPTPSSKLGLKG